MTNKIIALGWLKVLLTLGCVIASSYILKYRGKWYRFSQGLKPLLAGLLIIPLVIVMQFLFEKNTELGDIKKILILDDYIVGFSRMIILSYILLLSAAEILVIILMKKFATRKDDSQKSSP